MYLLIAVCILHYISKSIHFNTFFITRKEIIYKTETVYLNLCYHENLILFINHVQFNNIYIIKQSISQFFSKHDINL